MRVSIAATVAILILLAAINPTARKRNTTNLPDDRSASIGKLALTSKAELQSYLDGAIGELFPPSKPGVAISISIDSNTLLMKTYGSIGLDADYPVTKDSPFSIGSLTKQFTAHSVLALTETTDLSIDSNIADLLSLDSTSFEGKTVTVRHLLTHTSGLPPLVVPSASSNECSPSTSPECLVRAIARQDLLFMPGSKWSYSDLGYILLGNLIEKLTRSNLDCHFKRKYFEPLNMNQSAYTPGPVEFARSYEFKDNHYSVARQPTRRTPLADSAIVTSLSDLTRWHLWADSTFNSGPPTRAYSPTELADSSLFPYGFAWALAHLHGFDTVEHGGNFAGFQSYILRVIEPQLLIVVLRNSLDDRPTAQQLAVMVASHQIQRAHRSAGGNVPIQNPRRFSGYYLTRMGEQWLISPQGDRLFLDTGSGPVQEIQLQPNFKFVLGLSRDELEFATDLQGRVLALRYIPRFGPIRTAIRERTEASARSSRFEMMETVENLRLESLP